jgi:chromosome partitioning protein
VKRLKFARRLARLATVGFVVAFTVALLFWQETLSLVRNHDTLLKLVGLAIGPFLAVLGFFWGLVDKAELKQLAEELGKAKQQAADEKKLAEIANAEVGAKITRIELLERDLATVADSGKLWKLRPNAPFPEYKGWKYDPEGAKIVTVALFKGGVGKTHLAANFAAYVSETKRKPVLLIDLDYQGSLSVTMLAAAGIEPVGSSVDALFDETADLATLSRKRVHLANSGDGVALNHGRGLSQAWIVPADYSLTEVESRLLVHRVMHETRGLDERYRLAHLLLNPNVRRDYAMIIIDTPPRMTLGTVNALVASHCYVVPTILDRISTEAVRPFLEQVGSMKRDLALDLRLAGIVGTMTRQIGLTAMDNQFRGQIERTAQDILGASIEYVVQQNIPRKATVTSSDDIGYFLSDSEGTLRDRFYDAVFDDLWKRIMAPQESN